MKVGEKKRIRFRIYLVAFFFLLALGTVLARAYQLQIRKKDALDAIARNGYIGTAKLPPERGTIYDRKGRELALSVRVKSVYAHPRRIKNKRKTARRLARILKQKQGRLLRLLRSDRSFVWIARKIPPVQAQKVMSARLEGVNIVTETRRYYPEKESGAHLVGFVGADNQGLEGLEKKFDSLLRGPQCTLTLMRDALGRPFSVSNRTPSGHGMHDIILTIDKDIQCKAQKALRATVRKLKARAGNCLVVAPDTGEILAMAVEPEFNPNVFSFYRPDQWRNRAVTDCFEPGSTIKPFLLAACLEEHVLTTRTTFDCEEGAYRIGTHVIHDTKKHGVMNVAEIIVHSSNIGGVKMGRRLGYAKFYDYLKKFGFGSRLGNDFLGERTGFIRSPSKTREIDQATAFFGQGITGTSLQLAMAMGAIANGGRLMRPFVVKAVMDESGRTVKRTRPQVIRRVISAKTAASVSRVLEGVVSDEGTGAPAAIAGFRVAGKTGTSQKVDPRTRRYSRTKYVATFVGFVPAQKPRLVILVTVDEPKGIHYGGLVAGPVFKDVGKWTLNYLRVNPDVKSAGRDKKALKYVMIGKYAPALSASAPEKVTKGSLPDFRGLGMRQVLKKCRALGLDIRLEGTGIADRQRPSPGVSLKKVPIVRVSFSPPG